MIEYFVEKFLKENSNAFNPIVKSRTMIWLGEEVHKIKCEQNILFIEDGVISVMKSTKFSETIENALKEFKMYVLKPDLEARGLPLNNVIEGVEIVGYEEFVDLTTEHKTVQSLL